MWRNGNRILESYYRLTAYLGGLAMIVMMLNIGLDVGSRYFFGYSFAWVTDVTTYSLFITTFLVAAWILKDGGHITVDIVVSRLNPGSRRAVNVIGYLIAAVVCAIFAYQSGSDMIEAWRRGEMIGFPFTVPRAGLLFVLPLGTSFLTLQFLLHAYAEIRPRRAEATAPAVDTDEVPAGI